MTIKWKELFEQDNTVFHCETEDIAKEFLNIAHNHGYRWDSGRSFLNEINWNHYKENTCYNISYGYYASCFSGKKFYEDNGYNIIKVSELFGYRRPFKLNRK